MIIKKNTKNDKRLVDGECLELYNELKKIVETIKE